MDDTSNILSNERILCRTRRSRIALFHGIVIGFLYGLIIGAAGGAVAGSLIGVATGTFSGLEFFTVFGIILFIAVWRTIVAWRGTVLTITSKRILLQSFDVLLGSGKERERYKSLLRATTQTVRWDVYQEGVYEGGIIDRLGNMGSLTIRYGTADAARSFTLTSLPFASDLKHYCDKVHSLVVEKVPDSELPAFVPKKKGKRDVAVVSEWSGER
jgi:hypothetical protein